MSHDIIEIAVDRMTDADEFEKLATDVLYNEGYYDIVPMPGGNDFGQDAIEDRFFESTNKTNRTVFQYSLQGNIKAKILKTINRLNEAKVEFNELVYVSKREISGEDQENLKREIRKNFKISIHFFDRTTIANRLGVLTNGIFIRHFPNIDKQIEVIKSGKPILAGDSQKKLETSLLKVAISITFSDQAKKARKDVFDNLILSLIYECKGPESTDAILKLYQDNFDKEFKHLDQIKAAIIRLKTDKQVELVGEKIQITNDALKKLEKINIKANEFTESILDDIESKTIEISKKDLSKQECLRIRKNSLEVLLEMFKLYGLELSYQILGDNTVKVEFDILETLITKAKTNLSSDLGELLIAVIGNLLAKPNIKQAETLANWAKSFLGIKLMNIDPNLKELELTQFAKKIFLIDTDFLLRCIVKEHPSHDEKLKIIKALVEIGCKVIIPKNVLDEVLQHLTIAYKAPNRFGDTLFLLAEELVQVEIHNIFVQGYYYHHQTRKGSLKSYLSHYYNNNAPQEYLIDVIYDRLPKKVSIEDLSAYNVDIPKELFDRYANAINERLKKSSADKSRTVEERKKLSETDAHLFLTCYFLNRREGVNSRVLGGKAYLITNSFRYLRCCRDTGLVDIVTAKPQTLASILDIIGKASLSSQELLKLMDNPLLIYSVEQSWSDIEILVRSGIELNDTPLPKLKWDLQEYLHDEIAAYRSFNIEAVGLGENEEEKSMEKLDKFFDLVKHAEKLGYKNLPVLKSFLNELSEKEDSSASLEKKYHDLSSDYEALKSEIDRFGKRRKNYLERLRIKGRRS